VNPEPRRFRSSQKCNIFGLLFQNVPTYQELNSGTPSLEPVIKLNDGYMCTHILSMDDLSKGWNTLFKSLHRIHKKLTELYLTYHK